jgi:hypothetical protein
MNLSGHLQPNNPDPWQEAMLTLASWDQIAYGLHRLEQQHTWPELDSLAEMDHETLARSFEAFLDAGDDKPDTLPAMRGAPTQLVLMDEANHSWNAVDVDLSVERQGGGLVLTLQIPDEPAAIRASLNDWLKLGSDVTVSVLLETEDTKDAGVWSAQHGDQLRWEILEGVVRVYVESKPWTQLHMQEVVLTKRIPHARTVN